MPPDEQEDLKRIGERIEAAEHKRASGGPVPTTGIGIAFRLSTELVGAVVVGVGLGLAVDWAFDHWSHWHTRPWGLVFMLVLGAAAGFKNVVAATKEINAEMAKQDTEK